VLKFKKLEKNNIAAGLKIITKTHATSKRKEATYFLNLSLKRGTCLVRLTYYVLLKDDKVIGISGLYQDYEDPNSVRWLDYLAVDPKFQRIGYGTIILKNLEEICKKEKVKLICVFTDNKKAINFYRKNKFKIFGKINDYFPNADKVWLYKKL
jgi:ribosomal protein S18 acetylase RimI-like enzyme